MKKNSKPFYMKQYSMADINNSIVLNEEDLGKKVIVNKNTYYVNKGEFDLLPHKEYNNLRIMKHLGLLERLVGLLEELRSTLGLKHLLCMNPTHGGFVPLEAASAFDKVTILGASSPRQLRENGKRFATKIHYEVSNDPDILFNEGTTIEQLNSGIYDERRRRSRSLELNCVGVAEAISFPTILVQRGAWEIQGKTRFRLSRTEFSVYIPDSMVPQFHNVFSCYVNNGSIHYDNLLHLVIMVKDAGPQFREMLRKNLPFVDRWTLLDTGSTDGTLEVIQEFLQDKTYKKGELYQEPFVNFRDTRNRALELAGTSCKYIVTLDDTYLLQGDLREFLEVIRGDQFADSFSLYIQSNDTQYASNRVIKTASNLRYIHRIHEVITDKDNVNVIVPANAAFIEDGRFDYMEKRTMDRKTLDLKLLYEELEENPMEPRTYYYLGQTYNLLENYEMAYTFFLKRAEFNSSGFIQERIDALFEAARLANFKLNKPWPECQDMYEKAYKADESRPEAIYFIGMHYFLENDFESAYPHLKKSFEIGYPIHCQYSLKPTLSFHFLPKFICRLAYGFEDYATGLAAAELFLKNNPQGADHYNEMVSWLQIYQKLVGLRVIKPVVPLRPFFVFVADGGFEPWTGSTIITKGVGGSETYIIEMARHIQKRGDYQVVVFCNTPDQSTDVFEGVEFRHLNQYAAFISVNYVKHCIVSRFSEYLPVTFRGHVENAYLVVHDLTPSGVVIPLDPKLKKVFCLTEWHVGYFTQIYPELRAITEPFYYGIDMDRFAKDAHVQKVPYQFIYSSFPNRGLLPLLQMWPQIVQKQPQASLHIYADVNGTWVNNVAGDQMKVIRMLLEQYKQHVGGLNVVYHGWVKKADLAAAWQKADVWFYPCTFMETFCLTALEAAMSKTFVITNDLAALQNTAASGRAVIVPGDPTTNEWKNAALKEVFAYMEPGSLDKKNDLLRKNHVWGSQLSWENQAQKLLTRHIEPNALEWYGPVNPFLQEHNLEDISAYYRRDYVKEGGFEPLKVLEISEPGSGASLARLLQAIPHSVGWELSSRSKTDPRLFFRNAAAVGMEKRMILVEKKTLSDFVVNRNMFDLVYVNGEERDELRLLDMWLAWLVLNKGGHLLTGSYYYRSPPFSKKGNGAIQLFLDRLPVGSFSVTQKNGVISVMKIATATFATFATF